MKEIALIAKKELAELTGFTAPNVIGIGKREDLWHVTVEITEKPSESANLEILGIYDVSINTSGVFLGYERIMMRKRGELLK